jgi:hypothetical protein
MASNEGEVLCNIQSRCGFYCRNALTFRPCEDHTNHHSKERKKKKEAKKKASKHGMPQCRWNASYNILRAHGKLSLEEESIAHQISHVQARFPGSDFAAVRLVRLAGILIKYEKQQLRSESLHTTDATAPATTQNATTATAATAAAAATATTTAERDAPCKEETSRPMSAAPPESTEADEGAEANASMGQPHSVHPHSRSGAVPHESVDTVRRIIAAFENYRFWPTDPGEDEMIFWSENHMICYASTQFLVEQWRAERSTKATTCAFPLGDEPPLPESRARHRVESFLQLKLQYGFFEFNSTSYIGFTLAALLNLVDFSDDLTIARLAKECTDRLIAGVLAFAMPSGAFFSVTGRGYLKHRCRGSGFDINVVIWLLTGLGPPPTSSIKNTASFLATSSYCDSLSDDTARQWQLTPISQWKIGAPISSVVAQMRSDPFLAQNFEFVPFLWSMGGYFHPEVVGHTVEFIRHTRSTPGVKNLWTHHHFRALSHLRLFSSSALCYLAQCLRPLTVGSSLTDQSIRLFKRGDVLLSTVRSREAGCVGYQKVGSNADDTAPLPEMLYIVAL